jgi:hypothetical protein
MHASPGLKSLIVSVLNPGTKKDNKKYISKCLDKNLPKI